MHWWGAWVRVGGKVGTSARSGTPTAAVPAAPRKRCLVPGPRALPVGLAVGGRQRRCPCRPTLMQEDGTLQQLKDTCEGGHRLPLHPR